MVTLEVIRLRKLRKLNNLKLTLFKTIGFKFKSHSSFPVLVSILCINLSLKFDKLFKFYALKKAL